MRKAKEYLYLPIIGDIYGKWTIISEEIKQEGKKIYWKVQCKCGTEKYIESHTLRNKSSNSCMKCAKTKLDFVERYYNKLKYSSEGRKINFLIDLSYLRLLLENQQFKCSLSGLILNENNASLDRIDNDKHYTHDNIQWVHKDVNMMKRTLNQTEFIKICKQIAKKN